MPPPPPAAPVYGAKELSIEEFARKTGLQRVPVTRGQEKRLADLVDAPIVSASFVGWPFCKETGQRLEVLHGELGECVAFLYYYADWLWTEYEFSDATNEKGARACRVVLQMIERMLATGEAPAKIVKMYSQLGWSDSDKTDLPAELETVYELIGQVRLRVADSNNYAFEEWLWRGFKDKTANDPVAIANHVLLREVWDGLSLVE